MKTYAIAGIYITLNDIKNKYLDDNITHYETHDVIKTKHHFNVSYQTNLYEPKEAPINQKNPYIILNEDVRIIYLKGLDQQIKMIIKHDYQFHKIDMLFNDHIIHDIDEYVYTWLGLIFMDIALMYQLLPIHGASINDDGKSIIISAPSQTGKSTHAKLWLELDEKISIQNDDKPLIGKKGDTLMVYSSPFSGKTAQNKNIAIPLKALIFLEQSQMDVIEEMTPDDIIKEMMKNMMRPTSNQTWEKTLLLMNDIIQTIPIFKLKATPYISSAKLLKKHLSKRT